MKFRNRKEQYSEPYTRDGKTVQVPRTREVPVPVLPRNWDRIGVRFIVGLVAALTLVSVVWSTWSIGELLHGGFGYLAAVVFDLAWAVCLVMEYLARFDAEKRRFPNRLGWWLLVATMGAIFWHGMNAGSVGMAVTGAAVSAFAKVLWLGVMRHVHRELSPEDAAWVKNEISSANAMMAVADARRQAAQIEQRASLELLAMERERAAVSTAFGLPVADSAPATAPGADAPQAGAVAPGQGGATAPVAATAAPAALPAAVPTADVAAIVAAVLAAQGGASATAPGADAPHDAEVIEDQDQDQEEAGTILPPLEPPTLASLSKADAIRIAVSKRPDYTNAQVAELLAGYDVQTTADYVRQVRNRDQEERVAQLGDDASVVPIRKEA